MVRLETMPYCRCGRLVELKVRRCSPREQWWSPAREGCGNSQSRCGFDALDRMVLLVEGPDTHPHWARCVIPRGIALACVAMGAAFSSLRPGPVLRAMFFVDFVTMLGSESAVHVYLSALSPRSKRILLLLILLVDTSTLVAMLTELPEGWAAAIGRVLLFWLVRASLTLKS